ncbi:MAG: DoxX family protein [Bacteroidia bacterium]|nr:DoxX family protein [Bacteroidia bacterium]
MRGPFNINLASLILRVGFGLYMMLGHGWPKLMKFIEGGEIKFSTLFGLPAKLNLGIAVFVEVICAAMIAIGFRTRLFVVPMILFFLIVVFIVKSGTPWVGGNGRELAMMYLMPFLTIFVLGSGKFSVDELLDRTPSA